MNQILISEKVYVTREMKIKRAIYKTTYILSMIMIVLLIIYFVFAENNRNAKEAVSREILSQLEEGEFDRTTVETQALVIALDDNSEDDVPIMEVSTEDQTEPEIDTASIDGTDYNFEATLEYPRLDIKYVVLAEESEELLKISLCKYWGPSPNKVGNYCIVGHNYRSGKMFGNLSSSEIGDHVTLTDNSGNKVTYEVYTRYIVEPSDVSCTSQLTNGRRELTLITCTNFGKQRLVVKCREV